MANEEDSQNPSESQQEGLEQELDLQNDQNPDSSSDSDSDSDSSDEEEEASGAREPEEVLTYTRPGDESLESENTPEANIEQFSEILNSRRMRRKQDEEDRSYVFYEDLFDFPEDPEKWREEDLKELWADAPLEMTKPGWDPVWADEEDWDIVREEIKAGRDPPIAPFYLPYRRPYPAIPDNHYDISNPKAVIEELDRIEEFLKWVSYIFPDGSTYEGTVWDDLAHGKGVYEAENGLVRYEGEWLQNNMEGHGVVEVDIPDIEPVPGSKLEAKMRAEGRIIARDYMSPEDRKWLEMDMEDSIRLAGGTYEIPFYENNEWINQFGQKPEKGRYRYAGQWKHGRMHGCGVYEVNERTIYGRFYFGELLEDSTGCDENVSALHAGIAEVAAAKARMFVNKPDGMVREERGPYSDPQHPYFYEEEDVWMAPGFINQFYEVPEYWKTYVHEVDKEREMWLNSFYKAPLRLPMPAELEYWWSKDETPEFVLINKEHDPENDDPSQQNPEDPLILHTPTGRIINYVEDEEHGIRLFWQPSVKDGEEVDPAKAEFLPLGFDEFYGQEVSEKKESFWKRLVIAAETACKPAFERFDKWIEEKKKDGEMKMKLIEKELDLVEAEICLEEAIEDMDAELKMREKEEQRKVEMSLQEEEETSELAKDEEKTSAEVEETEEAEEEEDEEGEEEEDSAPSSFGNVIDNRDTPKNGQEGSKPGDLPFAASSLGFYSSSLISAVSSTVQRSFLSWKQPQSRGNSFLLVEGSLVLPQATGTVTCPRPIHQRGNLKAARQESWQFQKRITSEISFSRLRSLSRIVSSHPASVKPKSRPKEPRAPGFEWLHEAPDGELSRILSLHDQMCRLGSHMDSGI